MRERSRSDRFRQRGELVASAAVPESPAFGFAGAKGQSFARSRLTRAIEPQ